MDLKGKASLKENVLGQGSIQVPLSTDVQPVQLRGITIAKLKGQGHEASVLLAAQSTNAVQLLGRASRSINLSGEKSKALLGRTLISNVDILISNSVIKISFQ